MHVNAVIEKSLRALREYAQRKIYNKLVFERLHEQSQLGMKSKVIVALRNSVRFRKTQREEFYRKIVFVAEKRMMLPFLQWKEYVEYEKKEEKAKRTNRVRPS